MGKDNCSNKEIHKKYIAKIRMMKKENLNLKEDKLLLHIIYGIVTSILLFIIIAALVSATRSKLELERMIGVKSVSDIYRKQYPKLTFKLFRTIAFYSRESRLPTGVVCGLIDTESEWDQYAVSPVGAMSYTQLMPGTAKDLNVKNPFDTNENIRGGTRYLRYCLDLSGGDMALALRKYNAGPFRREYINHEYSNVCLAKAEKTRSMLNHSITIAMR